MLLSGFSKIGMLVALVIAMVACEEKIFTSDVSCDECYTDKYFEADLMVSLTINSMYPEVPLTLYEGEAEEGNIIANYTAYESPFHFYVTTDKKYTVKAEYIKDDYTIFAIDGTNLKVKRVSDACDEVCYVVENNELDVSLRKELFP